MKNQCYVLVYSDGTLAGIDTAAGGYPFPAYSKKKNDSQSFLRQVAFYGKAQFNIAQDYVKMFKELEIKEFHWEVKE